MPESPTEARKIIVVSGLSGAGKSSILRALEDLGYETVDNPPFDVFPALASRKSVPLAVGLDVRSDGFDPARLAQWKREASQGTFPPFELIYARAQAPVLLRRFTATRRRHPLSGPDTGGSLQAAIAREKSGLAGLKDLADFILDSSELSLPDLRKLISRNYGLSGGGMAVTFMSFAYPRGLPQEADLVFDMRWLRNPFYEEDLREKTGLEDEVAGYVYADPHFSGFFEQLQGMLLSLFPRFQEEGKKYLTIALGCSGGRHRSVAVARRLAETLREVISPGA